MKVYLDTNVVSAIAREDFPPDEMRALKQLLELSNTGKIELRASEVARREIESYKGEDKRTVEIVYLLLQKIPFVEDHEVLGFHNQWDQWGGGGSFPLVADDPISSELQKIDVERRDAHHLLVAIRAGCDVFLTFDERTILNRREEIEWRLSQIHNIRLMKPSEFVRQVALNEDGKVIWSVP